MQRSVFGLVQDGVHTERLFAVHRHHDCRSEAGSLCVVLVRLRFGSLTQKRLGEGNLADADAIRCRQGSNTNQEQRRRSNSGTPAGFPSPVRL